jgi:hypothetical protein
MSPTSRILAAKPPMRLLPLSSLAWRSPGATTSTAWAGGASRATRARLDALVKKLRRSEGGDGDRRVAGGGDRSPGGDI